MNTVAKEKMKKDTVVIGLGNTLMGDEGIGCVIAGRLLSQQEKYPGIEFIDAGSGGMSLLHIISGRKKAVIIDCAVMGAEPGTIKRFTPEQTKSVKQLSHYSLHEADVLQIIEMSRRLGECPETIVILGIEPGSVEHGRELSDALSGRLSEYIKTIEKELSE
jgi:hydrogenase maturation protease